MEVEVEVEVEVNVVADEAKVTYVVRKSWMLAEDLTRKLLYFRI